MKLSELGKKAAEKTHYTYKVIGVEKSDTGAIKSLQCDRGDKTTVFTIKRYQELVASGKISNINDDNGTFDLAVDPDFKPGNNFVAVDLA